MTKMLSRISDKNHGFYRRKYEPVQSFRRKFYRVDPSFLSPRFSHLSAKFRPSPSGCREETSIKIITK